MGRRLDWSVGDRLHHVPLYDHPELVVTEGRRRVFDGGGGGEVSTVGTKRHLLTCHHGGTVKRVVKPIESASGSRITSISGPLEISGRIRLQKHILMAMVKIKGGG